MLQHVKTRAANSIWKAACLPMYKQFRSSLGNCESAQERHLLQLLKINRKCLYGCRHSFSDIRTTRDFQEKVPLTRYEDYAAYIDQIAEGKKNILTRGNVIMFEPSSGTTAARKLIPYTAALKTEFQKGIAPWIVSLYSRFPELTRTRAYWSVSPSNTNKPATYGTLPVGFDDDWSYLGVMGRLFYSWIAVLPEKVHDKSALDDFRRITLSSLLTAEDLGLISVWSPSFLTLLLDYYVDHQAEVHAFIRETHGAALSHRISRLKEIGRQKNGIEKIWPQLQVISCWTDAASKIEAKRLKSFFPNTHIQGKGLLATESFVSLPFSFSHDPVLAIRSHFFEFLSESGEIRLSHQLEKGQAYSVVVTTSGGLYRYCLEDSILVTGFLGDTPTIRFVGKSNHTSDMFGEKLNPRHVAGIINRLFDGLTVRFCMLAPDTSTGKHHYTLFIQCHEEIPPGTSLRMENLLQENPNYRYCVDLGQLHPVRIYKIDGSGCARYEERCLEQGQKLGDIKPTALSTLDNWRHYFKGEYED